MGSLSLRQSGEEAVWEQAMESNAAEARPLLETIAASPGHFRSELAAQLLQEAVFDQED